MSAAPVLSGDLEEDLDLEEDEDLEVFSKVTPAEELAAGLLFLLPVRTVRQDSETGQWDSEDSPRKVRTAPGQ